jgi:hypothetical protein
MNRLFILLLIMLTSQLSAVMYTTDEIRVSLSNQSDKSQTQNFIREFFVVKNPQSFIDDYLTKHKNSVEPIILENMLFALLSEVAYHPRQEFLQTFVDQMKGFNVQAFRMHDEGSMPVALYNINAKANGVENIWLADESFHYYQNAFAKNPIGTLKQLSNNMHDLKSPQWLGLKNSLKNISQQNQLLLSNYLLENTNNRIGLDKLVSHFALYTGNEDLVRVGLLSLDKSNSEYLLRNLSTYFSADFVVTQLIDSVDNQKNQKFAISMMASYLEELLVQEQLVRYLANEKFATSAAIALTQVNDVEIIGQLENLYAKSNSQYVKKQILFTLQMNPMIESKTALNRISNQVDDQSKSAQWLDSFKGETK